MDKKQLTYDRQALPKQLCHHQTIESLKFGKISSTPQGSHVCSLKNKQQQTKNNRPSLQKKKMPKKRSLKVAVTYVSVNTAFTLASCIKYLPLLQK